jgi:hypothetical protein
MKWIVLAVLLIPAFSGCLNDFLDGDSISPNDLVTNSKEKWVIEIDYVSGHKPTQSAIDLLKTRMNEVVKKDSITVIVDDIIPSQKANLKISDFEALKSTYKDRSSDANTVVTYVLYLDGNSASDTDEGSVLGLAYSHTTVVMFDEVINNAANLRFSATAIEEAVLVHEFGHTIGLVNNGVNMVSNHEGVDDDGQPNRHSDNSASVMTPAVETTTNLANILGGLPTTFDSDDKADLCAFGGRC